MIQALVGFLVGILTALGLITAPAVPIAAPTATTTVSANVSAAVPQPTTSSPQAKTSIAATATSQQATASNDLPQGSAWLTTLPLGDGKYTTSRPEKGYIYVCHVAQGGGAQGNPTWIHGNTWTPSEKVAVQGSVSWPQASYSMTVNGSNRIIVTNDLPTDHPTGTFPIAVSDPAHAFDANPNTIQVQSLSFNLAAHPQILSSPDCIYGQVGIMTDGVVLFDGFDAEYRDAVAHETQDAWEGHPEKDGEYHDHGFESGMVKEPVSTVVGFAFDGFPITGSQLPNGNYLHTADLDECHGLTSTVTVDGEEVSMYHYVLTQDFPYSVSCFRGRSYEPKPGVQAGQGQTGSGAQSPQGVGGPPQAAIDACAGLGSNQACSFVTPNGTISGTCRMPPSASSLACVPG